MQCIGGHTLVSFPFVAALITQFFVKTISLLVCTVSNYIVIISLSFHFISVSQNNLPILGKKLLNPPNITPTNIQNYKVHYNVINSSLVHVFMCNSFPLSSPYPTGVTQNWTAFPGSSPVRVNCLRSVTAIDRIPDSKWNRSSYHRTFGPDTGLSHNSVILWSVEITISLFTWPKVQDSATKINGNKITTLIVNVQNYKL